MQLSTNTRENTVRAMEECRAEDVAWSAELFSSLNDCVVGVGRPLSSIPWLLFNLGDADVDRGEYES